jgi:hypothetical protein
MTVEAALIAGMQAAFDQQFADCTLSDPRRMAAALQAMWQPIETAPRDQRIVLYRPSSPIERARVVIGQYNPNSDAAKRPRPYWSHDCETFTGTKEARSHPPTHWCLLYPLPEP